jgi:hypothetical protein
MAGWADVCVYEDLCFDGSTWLLLDDTGAASISAASRSFVHVDATVGKRCSAACRSLHIETAHLLCALSHHTPAPYSAQHR